MRHLFESLVLLLFCFAITSPAWSEPEIVVSAAISLKNAFTDLGKLYEEGHPGSQDELQLRGFGRSD